MDAKSPFLGGGYYMVDSTWWGHGKVISYGWWWGSSYAIRNWHVSRISGIDHFANILASLVLTPSCHDSLWHTMTLLFYSTWLRSRFWHHFQSQMEAIALSHKVADGGDAILYFTIENYNRLIRLSLCDKHSLWSHQCNSNFSKCNRLFRFFPYREYFLSAGFLGSTDLCCDQHVTPFSSICTW